MLRSWMIISLLGMVGISSMGCQNKVHDENQALWKENRELRAKLSDTEGRLRAAPDATQMASMHRHIAVIGSPMCPRSSIFRAAKSTARLMRTMTSMNGRNGSP